MRLSSREDCAAVNSGKNADFGPDGTNFGKFSSVGTETVVNDLRADFFFSNIINGIFDFTFHFGINFRKMFENVFLRLFLFFLTRLAICFFESSIDKRGSILSYRRVEICGDVIQFHFELGLADCFHDIVDECNLLFDFFVSIHDTAEHNVFAYFVCSGFDHHDCVCGAAYVNMHCALGFLFEIGVDNVFAVNISDYNRSGRSGKRNIRNGKRDTRTEHCINFRRNVGVNRKSGCYYAHVVKNSLGEQRAERTIDKT